MHIWLIHNWEKNLGSDRKRRTGIYFKYEQNVDLEVKNACKNFARWLRRNYEFPMRVPIYIKGAERIKTMDGDWVVGSFFEPNDYSLEPYIRIATGDYIDLKNTIGRDNALASILLTIAHELTHYYQWINNLQLTDIGRERQATRYSHLIVDEYALTRDHP